MFRTVDNCTDEVMLSSRSNHDPQRDPLARLMNFIEINVVDEAKNIKKVFSCDRKLIL